MKKSSTQIIKELYTDFQFIFKKIKNDLLVVLILLFSGWKYTYGLKDFLDIYLYDESYYLYTGVKLTSLGLPVADGGLFYSIWYYSLSLLQPDNIELYYLNFTIITILSPILLYLVLRRYYVQIIPSLLVSFFFLISYANFPMLPKVSHFSLLVVLLSLVFISYVKKSLLNSLAIASIGALLSSYIRPELFLVFILLSLIYIGSLVYTFNRQNRSVFTILGVFILVSGGLILSLGIPFGENRSIVAFGQHFALNWIDWTNEHQLSAWTNWEEIIYLNFGNIHSVKEALFANPRIFFDHIFANIFNTIKSLNELIGLFFYHENIFLPQKFIKIEAYILLVLVAAYIVKTRDLWFSQLNNRIKGNQNLLIILGCYLLISFIPIIIIYPRPHYFLLPGVIMMLILAILVFENEDKNSKFMGYKKMVLLCLIVISITPFASGYWTTTENRPNIITISFIETLQINEEVNMLLADGGL
ncbi:MAG: hypothetical protein WDZ80_07960, partial [Candidatus Paceibacterota bacterium]